MRHLGEIDNTAEAVGALVEKRGQTHDALAFCYRPGPCGDGIHRQITAFGQDYMVVAPSLIPRRPGGRIKTNRRRRAPIHPKRAIAGDEHSCPNILKTDIGARG